MSTSAARTQGNPPTPNIEVQTTSATGNWQVWDSRSVSPAQIPTVSEPKRYSDTIIKVTDDGWRTVTQGSPLNSHFDVAQPMPSPAALTHEPTTSASLHPSTALAAQWFSQPPPNANFYVRPDAGFQHLPSGGEIPIYLPTGPLSRPHEFYQAPPPCFGMPMENKFQGGMSIPLHTQPMRPSAFLPVPGYCNINYSGGYQINYSKPPLDPFTDHSFGFEFSRNHLISPQFPIPPGQIHIPNQPNFIFSNSNPLPGILDSRMIPLMPFDYTPPPPQYLFPSPPQIQFPPLNGPPISSLHEVNSIGNFVPEDCREPAFANNYSSGLSPRHSRHSRNLQIRQQRTPSSSSSSSRGGNRNGHRYNQMGLPLSARSSVMEEFRSNKDKHWTLQDIFGHIIEFSGDQNGSRLIQQQLEDASEEDKRRVFDEIVPSNTSQLIEDVFGNYVIQKFFDLGTASQKVTISQEIEYNVINYSVHIYACRVVQKAFDHMSEEQQDRVIDRLAGNLVTCIKDQHGNHVIQKLIDTVAPNRLTFLRIISANIPDLAASNTGCRVLQRCLSKLPKPLIKPVLDAIDRHCDNLMRDQYGNYVIQFLLQHGDDDDKARVLARVRGSVVKLAKNQYASHVCEQAITHSGPQNRSLLIGEILTNTGDGHPIPIMMQDDFANYVLQRALAMAEGEQRVVLFHQAKSFLTPFRRSRNTYSKQLIKIERLVDRYFGKMDKTSSENSQGSAL